MIHSKPSLLCLLIPLLLTSWPALAKPSSERPMPVVGHSQQLAPAAQRQLDQLFSSWESYELELSEIDRQVRQSGRVSLHLGGRVFDLELKPADVRGAGFKSILRTPRGPQEEPRRPVATYKGHVAGDPRSSVRLLVHAGGFEGYIRTSEAWTFIQPLASYTRDPRSAGVVVFEDSNVRAEARSLCGSGEIAGRLEDLQHATGKTLTASTEKSWSNPIRQAEIAIEADYEYYQIHTYNTSYHIQSLINQVNGIYESELSLNLFISYSLIWTSEPDPYSAGNIAALVDELRLRWDNQMAWVQRDVAFLLSGKNMGAGLAYNPICTPSRAYAAMALDSASAQVFELKLVSHELGHTFGANHDEYFGHPCSGTGQLMCGAMQQWGPNTFSAQSKTSITNHLNQYDSCLRRLEYTLFTSQTPASYLDALPGYEVGTRFSSSAGGLVTGFRYFKAPNETGSHTIRLWSDSGTLLTSVTLPPETFSGWQQVYLPYAYRIYAGTYYRVTVNTNSWQSKTYCGISSPITNGPLTAVGGYWGTPTGAFPQNSSCSNYFVDILFRRD